MKIATKELSMINIMLNFVGYYAKKNEDDNKLDIYDKDDNNLYVTINTSECKDNISFYFSNKENILIAYTHSEDNYFSSFRLTKGNCEINLRIRKDSIYYEGIDITIDKNELHFSNHEYGEDVELRMTTQTNLKRSLKYTTYNDSSSTIMHEGNNELVTDSNAFAICNIYSNAKLLTKDNADLSNLSKIIISHPRNQELLDYLLSCSEEAFNGISLYIRKNFDAYKKILYIDHKDAVLDCLIESIIDHDCDLPQINNQKKKVK